MQSFLALNFRYVLEVYLRLLPQPRPQGSNLKKWVGPHPFFKGKALGTRLLLPVYFRFLQEGFLLLVRRDLLLHPHCIDGFLGHVLFPVAAFDIVGLCVLSSLCVKRIYSSKCYTFSTPNPWVPPRVRG